MYTLGHNFMPPQIHAGGLRYHGAGPIVSQLLKDRLIEARSVHQKECFEAGVQFARTEGIIPAPETTHAIAQVIREAETARKEGKPKTILFNLSGHGLVDMAAYDSYFAGELQDYAVSEEQIMESVGGLEALVAV
jgi:tryptophan synthase beta chain